MSSIVTDLLQHQLWADVECWTAIAAAAQARTDKTIRDRLHHVHQVQHFFVWAVGDRSVAPTITEPAAYATLDELRAYASDSHAGVRRCLADLDGAHLEAPISIPWFTNPPLTITVEEALTQMAMHSQWHRGQNAARLRVLGGQPPTTDLILWYWRGRPSASL